MDMTQILVTLISVVGSVLVAFLSFRSQINKYRAEDKDDRDKYRAMRAEETRMMMSALDASMELANVSANALTGGHNNGNVEEAQRKLALARDDLKKFRDKQYANAVNREA